MSDEIHNIIHLRNSIAKERHNQYESHVRIMKMEQEVDAIIDKLAVENVKVNS